MTMIRGIAGMLALALVGCSDDAPSVAGESVISGKWQGTVDQKGWDPYPLTLTLSGYNAGQHCGVVTYPSFKCGGTVTCLERDRDQYRLLESLEYGNCKNGGVVTLVLNDARIEWSWDYRDGQETATATLIRE